MERGRAVMDDYMVNPGLGTAMHNLNAQKA
jgi:hypothetical protein